MYCLYRDIMGLCTLTLVYGAMLLGQALFIYTVAYPTLAGHQTNGGIIFTVVLEILIFEILFFMMFWSHSYTMCHDPGFIPKKYSYQQEKLPPKFKTLIESKVDYRRQNSSQNVQTNNTTPQMIENDDIRTFASNSVKVSREEVKVLDDRFNKKCAKC